MKGAQVKGVAKMGSRLDANESPYPIPEAIWEEMGDLARRMDPHRYVDPERSGLREAIADYTGVDPAQVLVGNGSDDLILALCLALARGGTVVAPAPTFYMYGWGAEMAGAQYVEVPLLSDFDLDVPALLETGRSHPGALLFLCRPNNPSGRLYPREVVEEVLAGWPGPVVVDEAYYEFAGDSLLTAPAPGSVGHSALAADPVAVAAGGPASPVVVLRTFSKAFRLAGLRVGYAILPEVPRKGLSRGTPGAPQGWRHKIRYCLQPYNVSAFAQAAALVMLRHLDLVQELVEECRQERERLFRGIADLGLQVYPSRTNFILFRPRREPTEVYAALREQGIRIRAYPPPSLASPFLRVSVGSPRENDLFLDALAVAEGAQL